MNDRITLKDFVESNRDLLTVAGVFAALIAFFSSAYKGNPFSEFLSFFSFVIFLLLIWEIWIKFPKSEKASTNLKIFEYFFMMLVFSIAGQLLYEFRDIILSFPFLWLFFFAIYTFLTLKLVERLEYHMFVRKIAEKYKSSDKLIRSGGFLLIIVVNSLLSRLSTELVLYLIDLAT
jgi:hypothetical protein